MNYLSLFDGIGAAHSALLPLGYQCIGISEIDKNCNDLISRKFGFRNFGNFTEWRTWNIDKPFDLVIGGSPCQSFSTLGMRQGANSLTGQLTLDYTDFICEHRPKFFLWENVGAALTIDGGHLFERMLYRFSQFGYGLAWRILNSRFFGVPQHRRRVFLVGCFGDPIGAGKILFETETMSGDIATSREKGQRDSTIATVNHFTDSTQSRMEKHHRRYRQNNSVVGTLATQIDSGAEQVDRLIIDNGRLRYLLPVECERVQGFEDNYTEGFSDSTRYRMLGNSMPVPVIRWIGERILAVDKGSMVLSKAG